MLSRAVTALIVALQHDVGHERLSKLTGRCQLPRTEHGFQNIVPSRQIGMGKITLKLEWLARRHGGERGIRLLVYQQMMAHTLVLLLIFYFFP
jgi:hypothetical protein